MARSRVQPEADYVPNADGTPRTYGPFPVDSFTNANTSALRWAATVVGWPTDRTLLLFKVTLRWSNGDNATWPVYGGPVDRQGNAYTSVGGSIGVPVGNGNAVSTGDISVVAHAPFRTSFSLEAIQATTSPAPSRV